VSGTKYYPSSRRRNKKKKNYLIFSWWEKEKIGKIGGPSVDHANRCRRPFTACVSTPKKIK
jgi:hypothetical protein